MQTLVKIVCRGTTRSSFYPFSKPRYLTSGPLGEERLCSYNRKGRCSVPV